MRSHLNEIMRFFEEQQWKGTTRMREKDLKKWARDKKMSPTTLHEKLTSLWNMGYIIKYREQVKRGSATFYELSSQFRDWWIKEQRFREKAGHMIDDLPEIEKINTLEQLIKHTMRKFSNFVPYYIMKIMKYGEKHPNILTQENLAKSSEWLLFPLMVITAGACLRNKEQTLKLEIIRKEMRSFERFLQSDWLKAKQKEGIIPKEIV